MRIRLGLLVMLTATLFGACAGAIVRVAEPSQPTTASPQALAFFEGMVRAADSTGVEQAACVSTWTLAYRNGTTIMHIARVRAATVQRAHADSVRFECFSGEGTVHTHANVCMPSAVDRTGDEMFGVVVCPRPTRFAVFAVRPLAP